MALYLIDKPFASDGLELAALDPEAKIVLIQDGVYLDASRFPGKVFAVKSDAERRGVAGRLPASVRRIDHAELVDLIVAEKVYNFA
ncbi:MAG: hypothetical protein HYZ28_02195 [Myxococcales bacterium]|nr:hypothetical protein [Myxococcales bacterium]